MISGTSGESGREIATISPEKTERGEKQMKESRNNIRLIGIIQCDFAKERCSGFACINSFHERIDAFENYPDCEKIMVVPFNCGGCPERRIGRSVANLINRAKKKADIKKEEIVIHLASCMVTDNAH